MPLFTAASRYFDEVARAGSIQEASRRLNVAASAINRQILALEAELGVQLFERLARGMRLTTAGETLIVEVRRWRGDLARAKVQMEALKGLSRGQVTLATIECFGETLWPSALTRFRSRHPGMSVRLLMAGTEECAAALVAGTADVALAFNLPRRAEFERRMVMEWPIGLIVPPGHELAGRRPTFAECLNYPLVLPDSSLAIGAFLTGLLARVGERSTPQFMSNSIAGVKAMVTAGHGVSFLSELDILNEQLSGKLVFQPLADRAIPPDILTLATLRNRSLNAASAGLAAAIVEAFDATHEPSETIPSKI